jgi:hypothetical protein
MIMNRVIRTTLCSTWLAIGGGTCAMAQTPAPSVQWSASVKSLGADANNARATLVLSALIPEGWHVYALTQVPGGPTALRVTLEQGAAAQVAGAATGTTPETRHDPSFDLDTQFYTHAFSLNFPLKTQGPSQGAPPLLGTPPLPVQVRFQLCSERECQPPKTIHLFAPIEAPART